MLCACAVRARGWGRAVHSHARVMYPAYTCLNIYWCSEIRTNKIVQTFVQFWLAKSFELRPENDRADLLERFCPKRSQYRLTRSQNCSTISAPIRVSLISCHSPQILSNIFFPASWVVLSEYQVERSFTSLGKRPRRIILHRGASVRPSSDCCGPLRKAP